MFDDGDNNTGKDTVDKSDQSLADDVNGGEEEEDGDGGDNDNVAELLHHR